MSAVSPSALREGLRSRRAPDPCTVVIFGATGDLSHRKLMPALYRLARLGRIGSSYAVVGVARRAKTDEAFRAEMADAVLGPSPSASERSAWTTFAQGLSYAQADFGDAQAYERLRDALDRVDRERGAGGNRVYYLATAPEFYAAIVRHLGDHGIVARSVAGDGAEGWARVIVEKPFGRDLASAQELNRTLLSVFRENQIYRIDHYLGKETVQNILVFRFANGIFEPIWNQHFVDHIQITVAETVGVEGRAGYYEPAGAVRDIVQNHMMQLLTLVAMEAPVAFEADEVREEKVKVLRAARRLSSDDVPRNVALGQYGRGMIGSEQVPGYLQEPGVAPDSRTPTYVAMRMLIDNWRWAGVPFFLRSGKRLPKRATEIAVQFKRPPLPMFRGAGGRDPNLLALRIQPDEGISLRFVAKAPGTTMTLRPVDMGFAYSEAFGAGEELSEYERLLLDCMLGDPTLFTRRDEVEEAWELLAPVLAWWEVTAAPSVPAPYAAGTWGPDAARALTDRDGRRWRVL